jgi:3-(3-hydroxy-phenyl)propionate hydroxylase
MNFDTDVLIIGAGPVGMTLANELARRGVAFRIVDKAPGIREVSKAMILHVRTQEVLDKVGVAERAREEAQPLTEVAVFAYGKPIGAWDLDDIDGPYRHPLILGQNRTQHLLLDLLRSGGHDVQWNFEATALTINTDAAETTLRAIDPSAGQIQETQLRSRFVVGCEGSNSLVRKTLNFTFEGERYAGEQFIQADCRIKWGLPKGRSYLFLTSDGYMMVIEFPDDVVRIFISLPDHNAAGAQAAAAQLGAVEATSEEPTLEEIRSHLTRLSGFECELSAPTWRARYRTSHRYANRFSEGRGFVCGDAGHVHVPIGGQGMNTGIQDAFNLGWKLAGVLKGELQPSVLRSYHEERHPVAVSLIKGTDFAYTGILHPSEARQRAIRLFGPYLIRNERVQNLVRGTLEELNVSYPNSPLNLDLGGARGPKPGERVLDATIVRDADKATLTLSNLTRGDAWTLLLFSGLHPEADETAARASLASEIGQRFGARIKVFGVEATALAPSGAPEIVLLDALHEAHERYGVVDSAFYLLRPDTYVSSRGPLGRGAMLIAHLAGIFG